MIRPQLYNGAVSKLNRDILPTNRTMNSNNFKSRHNLKVKYSRTLSPRTGTQYYVKTRNGRTDLETTFSFTKSHSPSSNNNFSKNLLGTLYPLTAEEPQNSPKNVCCCSHPVKIIPLLRPTNHNNQVPFGKLFGTRQYSTSVPMDPPTAPISGIWKLLSESAPVQITQESLIWLHAETGLPWWATVILTTVAARGLITLPLAIYQNNNTTKIEKLMEEMNGLVEELKAETNLAVRKFKWPENYARTVYERSLKEQWKKLIIRDNCHPMKGTVLILVQIPLWITLSTALRNMCYMLPHGGISAQVTFMELTVGGFGWIPNLTDVDHSLILPVTLGILNLSIIEVQTMLRFKEPSKFQRYLTNFFRFVSIGMIPLAAIMPSCISLYWMSSSAFGFFQNLLLLSPKFRRMAGIPLSKSERSNPYRYLLQALKERLGLNGKVERARKA